MKKCDKVNNAWRGVLLRLPWLLLLPLGLLLPQLAAGHADRIEQAYCSGLYPRIKDAISAVSSLLPFSLAELLLYACCIVIPLWLLFRLFRAVFSRRWRQLVSFLLSLSILAGAMILLFYVSWGLNYFRKPLSARLSLSVEAREKTELYALTCELAAKAAAARDNVAEDDSGVFALSKGTAETFRAILPAYRALGNVLPVFAGKVTRAKPVLWSRGLSWAGIAGIYIGFTAEPNVNVDQPALLIAAGAAHETAHQLGIASEDEAEFTAYLACLQSDDADLRYSGLMNALISCGNALYRADPALFTEASALYSDGMRRDLTAYNAYWNTFDGPVEETANTVNDNYLKHNAQESGVQSYGEVVDLLLAWRAAQ